MRLQGTDQRCGAPLCLYLLCASPQGHSVSASLPLNENASWPSMARLVPWVGCFLLPVYQISPSVGFQMPTLFSRRFGGRKSELRFTALKSSCQPGWFLLGSLRRGSAPQPLPVGRLPAFLDSAAPLTPSSLLLPGSHLFLPLL